MNCEGCGRVEVFRNKREGNDIIYQCPACETMFVGVKLCQEQE